MGEELNGEELEPAVSVGQMENALQGATEDAAAVKGRQGNVNAHAGRTGARGAICMNRTAPDGFANGVDTPGAAIAEKLTHTEAGLKLNGVHTHTVNGSLAAPTPEPQGVLESQERGELGAPSASSPLTPAPCQQMPAALRTMSNGSERAEEPEQPAGPEPQPPERLDPEQPDKPEPEPEPLPLLPTRPPSHTQQTEFIWFIYSLKTMEGLTGHTVLISIDSHRPRPCFDSHLKSSAPHLTQATLASAFNIAELL